MKRTLLLSILFMISISSMAQIEKMIDKNGKVTYSNIKEEIKGKKTIKIDTTNAKLNKFDEEKAKERLQKLEEKAKKITIEPIDNKITKQSYQNNSTKLSCKQQWEIYDKSYDCFNPYRNVNGSVKAEAFKHCSSMDAPKCVYPSN